MVYNLIHNESKFFSFDLNLWFLYASQKGYFWESLKGPLLRILSIFRIVWHLSLQTIIPRAFFSNKLFLAAISSFALDLRSQWLPGTVYSCQWHSLWFIFYQPKKYELGLGEVYWGEGVQGITVQRNKCRNTIFGAKSLLLLKYKGVVGGGGILLFDTFRLKLWRLP